MIYLRHQVKGEKEMEKNWNEMTRLEKLMQILDEEDEERKNKKIDEKLVIAEKRLDEILKQTFNRPIK